MNTVAQDRWYPRGPMRPLLLSLLVFVAACAAEHPPQGRILSAQEAMGIATEYARSHGVVIDDTQGLYLDQRTRRHVDLGGAAGRDHAAVMLDGYSGQVLSARLRGASGESLPQPPRTGAPQPPAAGA